MEAELNEWSKINSKTENLVVTDEEDVDEAIPIYLKKNENTQACQKTMNIDIDHIKTFER